MMGFKFHYQVHCLLFFLYVGFKVDSTIICNPEDSLALLQFKNTSAFNVTASYSVMNFCNPKTLSWVRGTDCCFWEGVTCNNLTGNVIGLDLSSSCLSGIIDNNNTLFQLSHLQRFSLAETDQFTPIPSAFCWLRELTHLNLSKSGFSGLIPLEISHLSKLVSLDLSDPIQLSFGKQTFALLAQNLTRLSFLHLGSVVMSSVSPDLLLNLSSSISILSLGDTGMNGKFPTDIFCLPGLHILDLSSNINLAGFLPQSNWSSPFRFLELSYTSFKGEIPDSIGNLKFLQRMHFEGCYFTGTIPASIGNLTQLIALSSNYNALTGQLPSSTSKLKQLTDLYLSRNSLAGRIPNFGNLSKLIHLDLSHNNFSGPLSNHLNQLLSLIEIDLSNNFLTGIIPFELFSLPSFVSLKLSDNAFSGPIDPFQPSNSLESVFLNNNKISGSIPSSTFELVNLTYLDLSSNNFRGTLQLDMLLQLKFLSEIKLSYNTLLSFNFNATFKNISSELATFEMSSCNINGEFPSNLRIVEFLFVLDLSNNKIHGGILKSELGGWKSLAHLNLARNFLTYIEHHPWRNIVSLDLSNNMLQGSLLVPPFKTETFLVSNNELTGVIPPSICNLSSLLHLSLSNNNLNGRILQCFGSLALLMLHLQKNNLHGSIPDIFANSSELISLDLNGNKLEGRLPRSLVDCIWLEVINVGNNKIRDEFPYWLGTLSELKVLVLRSNRFYGPIQISKSLFHFSNLQILDLSHNEFKGFLPRKLFQNLGAMMDVAINEPEARYIGDYYYNDSVVVTMKGRDLYMTQIITIFKAIDLSYNNFQGEIPGILENFKSLIVLNLAHNSITGDIPSGLGNLKALESLDLSLNKLYGRIPVQLGGQFDTFTGDYFIGNKGLCGRPLPKKCNNDLKPQLPPPVSEGEDDNTIEFVWKIAMMGYGSGLVIGLSIGYIVFSTGKPWWLVKMVESGQQKIVRRYGRRRCSDETGSNQVLIVMVLCLNCSVC
ncbi:receptor-like protein 7 [Mangifera indica]|uniref:receptor-like protein 7 n=1 Tax=Mangifera indica TaxID=29780 RepID=UPI001CF98496|nr:receptor-like protein 7 [Mangifera indica]